MLSRWLNGLPQLNTDCNPSASVREVRFAYAAMADGISGGLHSRLPIIAGGQIRPAFAMGEMRLVAEGLNATFALPFDLPRIARGGVGQLLILTISGGLRHIEAGIVGKGDADGYEGIGINARRNEVARRDDVTDMVEQIVNNRISHSHVGSRFRKKM